MKTTVFLALISMMLLASCGLTKSEVSEITDELSQTSQVKATMEKNGDKDTMMKDDDMMMEGDHEGEWTEEEMKAMEMDGEHGDDMMKDDDMMKNEDTMMKDESMEKTEVMTKELAGTYADYDASLVGATDNTVIFFHAAWCPSCRAADTGISGGTVPEGLTILKTDFDSQTALKKKYKVVAQHTFVQVDAAGNEIKKWVGGNSVEDVVERLQ